MRGILLVLAVLVTVLFPGNGGAALPSRSTQGASAAACLAKPKNGGCADEQIHILIDCWKQPDGAWF